MTVFRYRIGLLDGGDELVREILALYIYNAEFRMRAAQHICNRVHQMGLAQTRVAVDEEREGVSVQQGY